MNNQNKVVGIIKGGVVSFEERDTNENQGFVPIDLVIENYNLY